MHYAHGAIQWLAADAVSTTYTVSGLAFQPKALKFYWMGLGSATDTASSATHYRRGMGFAVSTSLRRCVAAWETNAAPTTICAAGLHQTSVVATIDPATPSFDGFLDLDAITSDGFRLIVDDQIPTNLTVFWEAYGGADITVATIAEIVEPAAAGNVDYTVTGFVAGATDQIVMFAGIQTSVAVNTAQRTDSGFMFGAGNVTGSVVAMGNADDASTATDTDGYCKTGEVIAHIAVGGGLATARANLTQFGTNNFRLNWITRALTNRRHIYLAIKGGAWAVGATTINGNTLNATATISGLAFPPAGISLLGQRTVEDTAAQGVPQDRLSLGSGTSPSSRRAMGALSEDVTASSNAEINHVIEYDQILAYPSTTGTLLAAYDLNAVNADGFQVIVDVAGGVASEWIGYVACGTVPEPALLAANVTLALTTAAALTTEIHVAAEATVSITATGALTVPDLWTFLQSGSAGAFDDVHTAAFPADVQAGTLLLAVFATLSTGSDVITGIADTRGNTYTRFSFRSGFGAFLTGYWAVNASAGPNTVTVTLDGVNRGAALIVLEYEGNAASAPFDQATGTDAASGSTAANGDQTPDVTTTTDGQLVVGAIFPVTGAGATTFAPGTSPVAFTERTSQDSSGWFELQTQDTIQASAGTIRSTWTASAADNFHSFVASFKPVGVAAGAELEADITVSLTTAGTLTTEIRLSAAPTLALTTAAQLTTAITLAATPSLSLTTTGALTTEIRLAASAAVAITTTAELTAVSPILLDAAAVLAVTTSAALTTAITLGAGVTAAVTAAGSLTTAITLAGTVTVQVTTSATLTVDLTVAGAATVQITATADLTTYTAIAGAAVLAIHATATLLPDPALLAGEAALTLVTAADLTTEIHLAGDAVLVVLAQGLLGSIPPSIVHPSVRVVKPGRTTQPIPSGRAGVVTGAGRTVGNSAGPRTAAPVRSSRETTERVP